MTAVSSKVVVLNPTHSASSRGELASRPDSLRGKVVGLLWNNRANGDLILNDVAQRLGQKYGLSKLVHRKKEYIGEPSPRHVIDELASSCDVVITALGN